MSVPIYAIHLPTGNNTTIDNGLISSNWNNDVWTGKTTGRTRVHQQSNARPPLWRTPSWTKLRFSGLNFLEN